MPDVIVLAVPGVFAVLYVVGTVADAICNRRRG